MESPSQDALNEPAPLPHKLAAILYADVEGYFRLTGADEAGTHRTLSAYLDLFAETIKAVMSKNSTQVYPSQSFANGT